MNEEETKYDFSHLTINNLMLMANDIKEKTLDEDEDFYNAILIEIKNRANNLCKKE